MTPRRTMAGGRTGRRGSIALVAASCLLLAPHPAAPQRLAQRNWEGSGLTPQAWWPRATFCDVDPRQNRAGGVKSVTARLDALQAIGCEALVLDLLSAAQGSSATSLAFGTLDDADELIGQMGRRKLRLVLDLPLHPRGDAATRQATLDRMRFWLARGVAGFVLRDQDNSTPAETAAVVHQAHLAAAAALGTRILISEGLSTLNELLTQTAVAHRSAAEEVQLTVRRLPLLEPATAASTRTLLSSAGSRTPLPLLALEPPADLRDPQAELAELRVQATVLLGHGAAALLPTSALTAPAAHHADDPSGDMHLSAEETRLFVPLGGDATGTSPQEQLAKWYSGLGELRHTSAALRTGTPVYLDRDAQDVLTWVLRPKGPGPALLFVCNLSGKLVHVSLATDLHTVGIRGNFLHTVLTTEPEPPSPASLDTIELGADGVLVGEIR